MDLVIAGELLRGRRAEEEGGAEEQQAPEGDAARGHEDLLFLIRSGKLYRARSRLYRGQILQENMRLKALAEIYTMHSFAQLCNLIFCQNFAKNV